MGSNAGRVKPNTIKLVFVASLKRTSKEWLAPNQNNVSERSDISTPRSVVSVYYHYAIQLGLFV